MKKSLGCVFLLILAVLALIAKFFIFTVDEKSQYIVTRFGVAVGKPITTAGIKFKMPFVDIANQIPKQILEWDGPITEMPTKEKTFISVDTYARWRITDPELYFKTFRDERRALTRLDDILGSETRNVIAKNELIETIRTTKDRKAELSGDLVNADSTGNIGHLPPIKKGRALLEKEILETSKPKLAVFGIELLDIRFKRINYNKDVQPRIFERMTSERSQIAERFRSEGAGEAAKILGNMEKDLAEIESGAYKESETIKGAADAKASEIYAKAYGSSKESAEFYEFVRTMGLYEKMMAGQSTIVMSTDSDLFKYLKSVTTKEPAGSAPKATVNQVSPPLEAGLPSRN